MAIFKIPENVEFGVGVISEIGHYASQYGKRVYLISDSILDKVGIVGTVSDELKQAGLEVHVFLDVKPEPSIENVGPCLENGRRTNPDVIVGVGGGSVLDVAKVVAMMLRNSGKVKDYIGADLVPNRGVPCILLPTTAGTGAEATQNALFYIPELREKKAVVSTKIIPDVILVDPELTYTAPPKLTAATGMDALCHAIESYTALNANLLSRPFSKEAIILISRSLARAVSNGDDVDARTDMALGSLYAGIALANSGTNAVHALAYPLQGLYRIEHGVANSLLLPYVMRFNYLGDKEKFAEVATLMGVATPETDISVAAEAAAIACKDLSKEIGIPQHMSDVGVSFKGLEDLVEGALNVQRLLRNNPREITSEDIVEIYREAM